MYFDYPFLFPFYSLTFLFVPAMKYAIAALVLTMIVAVKSDIFDENGLEDIASIIASIDTLEQTAVDLNIMESRLEGLDEQTSTFESVKNVLTNAMDVDDLSNNFEHENTN